MGKQEPFKDPPRRKHQTQSNIHRKNRIVLAYFLVTQPRWIESVRKCATAERRQKAKHLIKDFWMGGWGWRYELVHLKEDGIRTGFCTRYMQIRQKRSCPDTTIHSATTRATLKWFHSSLNRPRLNVMYSRQQALFDQPVPLALLYTHTHPSLSLISISIPVVISLSLLRGLLWFDSTQYMCVCVMLTHCRSLSTDALQRY